ncbi:MAG TPA: radical SAM protein [Candidatus Hydrogenedens sp.]|nr:radical SAM protein [Candidatus Hydrogenedens sp.]
MNKEPEEAYRGFEQGPIRPPSEAFSLLIRITRNCPWNRCAFCPVYKGSHFSIRPLEHVLRDIEQIARSISLIHLRFGGEIYAIDEMTLNRVLQDMGIDLQAFISAVNWYATGMRSVFLQDANSLVLPTEKLLLVLNKLTQCFPSIQRITSYARSQTIYKKSLEEMKQLREQGLNRIHIGLESGSDKVLKFMKKGVTKEQHIEAGQKVMNAGIELSEYYMPGLGGKELWEEHAIETADALNKINPTFIRLRTLAIPSNTPLYEEWKSGNFKKCTDEEIVHELLCFIEHLDGITSIIKSDHILNLLPELEGRFPEDKGKMITILNEFLNLPSHEKLIFQVGRRMGLFDNLSERMDIKKRAVVERVIKQYDISNENIEDIINQFMSRML